MATPESQVAANQGLGVSALARQAGTLEPQSAPRRARKQAAIGISSRLERLLARFLPTPKASSGDHRLTLRNIYVLPTGPGLMLGFVLVIMLVCSINYGLALGYALSFLVFAIGLIALLHTYRNLASLTLRVGRIEQAFAGGSCDVGVSLINSSPLERFAIRVDVPEMSRIEWLDVEANGDTNRRLAIAAKRRGWNPIPRLTLATRYPLGLWRAWTYWQPKQSVLIFPEPEVAGPALPETRDDRGDGYGSGKAEEDVAGIRPYRSSDSPRQIAWTAMARTASDELLSKLLEGANAGELLLDFDQLPSSLSTEARLSRLTRWVVEADQQGIRYGLKLAHEELEAAHGPAHRQACLEALALYGTAQSARPDRMPEP